MAAQTILIIRHADKPEPGGDGGIDLSGSPDRRSLTPRGWQRAGVWTELFAPSLGQPPMLPKPTAIFASAPATHAEIAAGDEGSKSRRPVETVTALAAKLGIPIDQRFTKGREADLATAISTVEGVVLVCWQHEDIAAIAKELAPDAQAIPDDWPGNRFNVIFKFDRPNSASPWSFEQVVPVMLAGDTPESI
jgi:hypothetical protein